MASVAASDIYPAVRRFLLENGLQRALKAFDKETSFDESANAGKGKKARALAELELTEACRLWLDGRLPATATNGDVGAEEPKKKKKRKASGEFEVAAAGAAEEEVEQTAAADEERPKKKRRKSSEAIAQEKAEEPKAEDAAEVPKASKKEKKKEKAAERTPGVPFKRIDDDKWKATIKDSRLMDNTHKAKDKFGDSAGDSWGDRAAEDLLKVKGKGFRKEMQKKKRASWRGGGEIDQGVNSIKLDESSDEE